MNPVFASDNCAAASPQILEALQRVNDEAALPYGEDSTTASLRELVKELFGYDAEVYPVFNGTGANVVSLQALLPRWGAAICTQQAHVNNDEGGAPERLGAMKLLAHPTQDGKLRTDHIKAEQEALGFVHAAQPLAVSLTQSTEVGTVYQVGELAELAETAHSLGMGVHMDGARISNAAAALGVSLREITTDVGVDILSLGGTKNGALGAEAVVVLNPERVNGTDYIQKFSMQLASKSRFVSAQLLELFGTDLWRRNAEHANAQAAKLGARLAGVENISLSRPTEVNAVFPQMPPSVVARVQEEYLCHVWERAADGNLVVRLMCSFQTTDEDIDDLVTLVASAA